MFVKNIVHCEEIMNKKLTFFSFVQECLELCGGKNV